MLVSIKPILAGGAAVLAAAVVAPALAGDGQVHVLSVQLPGGGVEQIQYSGEVVPRVVLVPNQPAVAVPMFAAYPFATPERISGMMDQQAAAMLQQVQTMHAAPISTFPGLPPGSSGYSFVSTMSGNGVCMRSVQITFNGANAAPKMVSSTSGDCGRGAQPPAQINVPTQTAHPMPNTIEVKAITPAQVPDALHKVAWNR
jgi:hypothetical protein